MPRLDRSEGGYVLVAAAMLLLPLTIFAALAVDVGGWAVHANRLQVAADAAALSGATALPDHTLARAAALEAAAKNGFADRDGPVTVTVDFPSELEIRVEITDRSDQYLSQVVLESGFSIRRFAVATTAPPLGFASPSNVFGFGPYSLDGAPVSNHFSAEANDCNRANIGDVRAAQLWFEPWCSPAATPRQEWKRSGDGRDNGYRYVVSIPPELTTSSRLYVWDPGKCPAYGAKPGDQHFSKPGHGTELSFRQWSTGGTTGVRTDDRLVTGYWSSQECAADLLPADPEQWTDRTQGWTTTPFVFPANTTGVPEEHIIQTRVGDSVERGWNYHSLWVRPENGTTSCTSIADPACPRIQAEDWAAGYAVGTEVGGPMEIYLTEAGPIYQGRTMLVYLWDTGQDMESLQVIDPNGNPIHFTWTTSDGDYGEHNPAERCGGEPCLFTDPTRKDYPPPIEGPGWSPSPKFSGRIAILSIDFDEQIDFSSYPNYWFRLRFNPQPDMVPDDYLSVAVAAVGDPIALVD